jgi:HK97 family phage prohead protease
MDIPFDFQIEVYKSYVEEDTAEEKWFVEGYASTSDVDLVDDIISPLALQNAADDLLNNSTVLFNHNVDQAIGKVVQSEAKDGKLKIKALISQTVPTYWKQIQEGVLNKFSIRGQVIEAIREVSSTLGRAVRVIQAMKLLEVSLVNLPANPEARVVSWYVSKSLNDYEIKGGQLPMIEKNEQEIDKNEIFEQTRQDIAVSRAKRIPPTAESYVQRIVEAQKQQTATDDGLGHIDCSLSDGAAFIGCDCQALLKLLDSDEYLSTMMKRATKSSEPVRLYSALVHSWKSHVRQKLGLPSLPVQKALGSRGSLRHVPAPIIAPTRQELLELGKIRPRNK